MSGDDDHVSISTERLKCLEEMEASMPTLIETALKEYKQNALKRLHERDKANPEAVNSRARRYAERHRDELNAKRRQKRLEQRLAKSTVAVAAPPPPVTRTITVTAPQNKSAESGFVIRFND